MEDLEKLKELLKDHLTVNLKHRKGIGNYFELKIEIKFDNEIICENEISTMIIIK